MAPAPSTHLDLQSLDLLVSVMETGSISRAAEHHRISQPSASARLRSLERALGLRLLERSPAGSRLTFEGAAIAERAREVLAAADRLASYGESLRSGTRNQLRIAASPTVSAYLLPAALARFGRDHPRVQVSARTAPSAQVIRDVQAGTARLGFIETRVELPDAVHSREVGRDRLVVVVPPPREPRARRPATSEVLGFGLAVGQADGDAGLTFTAAAEAAGHPAPVFRIELGSDPGARALAEQSGQPTLLSELAVREDLASGRLMALPLELELERPLRAIWVGRLPARVERLLAAMPKRLRAAA